MLGRTDCGQLAPGKRADVVIWDMTGLEASGAWDPVAALVLCAPVSVRDSFVEGRSVVRDRQLVTSDLPTIQQNAATSLKRLMD